MHVLAPAERPFVAGRLPSRHDAARVRFAVSSVCPDPHTWEAVLGAAVVVATKNSQQLPDDRVVNKVSLEPERPCS